MRLAAQIALLTAGLVFAIIGDVGLALAAWVLVLSLQVTSPEVRL